MSLFFKVSRVAYIVTIRCPSGLSLIASEGEEGVGSVGPVPGNDVEFVCVCLVVFS